MVTTFESLDSVVLVSQATYTVADIETIREGVVNYDHQ